MKMFYNKNKYGLVLMVVLAIVVQMLAPMVSDYIYAQGEDEPEEIELEKTKDGIEKENQVNKDDLKITESDDETVPEDSEKIESGQSEMTGDSEETKEETEPVEVDGNAEEAEVSEEVKDDFNIVEVAGNKAPEKNTENIIKEIRLKYKDGSEFKEGDLIGVDEDLRFELDWSLPNDHGYKNGDCFEFELPKQLTVYNPLDGQLKDYGSFTVDKNGNVKFIFNEKIEEESNIKGTFWFDTELKESTITSTEETIEIVYNEEVVQKIIVKVKPTGGQAISKEGQPVDGNFNTEEVEWTVVVNTTRESLKNAIINDPILTGQELILDSLVLKEVEVDLAGTVIKELGEVTGFTNNSTIKELNIKLGNTNKAYKLTFKTKLLEDGFEEGTTNYTNTAFLKSDGIEDAQAGGSVSVSRPKSMEKTSSAFDKEDRSIEWTVNANFTEQNLKKDDVITDEFTFTVGDEKLNDIFEIIEEDITIEQVGSFDDEGKPSEMSNAKDLFKITIDGNKITYKLKEDSSKAFILKYKTELKEGAYINKDGKITNKIDLNGKTATGSQGVYQQVGKKTNAGINYKDKTIDWTITINADKQDLRNFVLTDSFAGSGQKLVEDSIKGVPENAKFTSNVDLEGFEIDFGNITDTYTITYQTKFTYDFEDTKKPDFKNGVKITYKTSDGSEYELEFGNTVKPNEQTKSNGAKNGTVDNKTKEITWKIDINYNQLELTDAKVKDAIPENQSLIDDSVKIYETTIDEKGGITVGKDVTGQFTVNAIENQINVNFGKIDKSYRVEFKTKDKDGIYNSGEVYTNTAQFIPRKDEVHNLTAKVTLPNQGEFLGKTGTHNKKDWTIDWKIDVNKSLSKMKNVKVTDDLGDTKAQILLENTIKMTKAGLEVELVKDEEYKLNVEGNKFEIEFIGEFTEAYEITYSSYILAEKTVDLKNEASMKLGEEYKGTTTKTEKVNIRISTGGGTGEGTTGGLVIEKFESDSKRALKDIAFTLVKTIGNQEIVVHEGTTGADGKLEWKGLKYGKYTLKEVIPDGYLGEVEREVELSSENPEGVKTLPIENTRKTGTAKIIKKDANQDKKLEGAVFELINTTTGQKYTLTTDTNGEVTKEVPFGEYTVKEITAPNGYRITKDIPNINVEIDKTATIEVKNVAIVEVSGQKTWIVDEGIDLPNEITVELYANGEKLDVNSKTVTSNDDWKYSFENLDKYDEDGNEIKYNIKEVKVEGYNSHEDGFNLINIPTTEITGIKEWIGGSKVKPTIELQLYRDGEKFGDVVELKDGETKYTWTELDKTDKDGKVYKYTIDEVRTPSGYRKSISDDGLTITNTYVPPVYGRDSLELIKLGEDGKLLEGAVFELLQDNEVKYTSEPTNSEGRVLFDNIAYGTYTVREKIAPEGYNLGTKTQEINITTSGKVKTLEFENTKIRGNVKLIKVDNKGNLLEGAEFALYDSEGKIVGEKVKSNKEGEVIFEGVAYGKYTIKETKAPEGYKMSEKEYKIEIKENGRTVVKDMDGEDLRVENIIRPDQEDPTNPEDPMDPEDPETPGPTDPEEPTDPTDPEDPEKPILPTDPTGPGGPKDPNRPGYEDGNLVKTGTDINFLIPIGFIMMLIGAAFIFKEKRIKE